MGGGGSGPPGSGHVDGTNITILTYNDGDNQIQNTLLSSSRDFFAILGRGPGASQI